MSPTLTSSTQKPSPTVAASVMYRKAMSMVWPAYFDRSKVSVPDFWSVVVAGLPSGLSDGPVRPGRFATTFAAADGSCLSVVLPCLSLRLTHFLAAGSKTWT